MSEKVIKGKKYSTETARQIAHFQHSYPSDFNHYEETLYCSPNGQYFLVGSGGPMSKYVKSIDQNSWSGSDDNFTLLQKGDALKWCEDHDVSASVIHHEFQDLLAEG